MSQHLVFIDESLRSDRYLLCGVMVEAARAGQLRRQVRGLLLPGQRRLHFKLEGKRRRRVLLDELAALDVDIVVLQCRVTSVRSAEEARAECLTTLVVRAQSNGEATTLYIERRNGLDALDRATIVRARSPEPALNFEHLRPHSDPLLWLPDAFAWAVGARGEWLGRVRGTVTIEELP